MKCKKIKLLLSEYSKGELDRWEISRVEKHLKHCLQCQEELSDLKDLEKKITIPLDFEGMALTPQFEMRLRARVKALESEKSGFTISRWAFGVGTAVVILLLLLAISLNYPYRPSSEGFNEILAQLPLEELEAIDNDLSMSEESLETVDFTYKDMLKTMLKDHSPENIEMTILEDAPLEEMLKGLSPAEEQGIIEAIKEKLKV